MFKLETERTFKWPVTVKVPVDGGEYATAPFDATFRLVSQEEIDQYTAGQISDRDFLKLNTVGWSGVQNADGSDLPFSQEALGRMIGIPYVRSAMMLSYLEAMAGSRRKN